jgi:hypothetical protein
MRERFILICFLIFTLIDCKVLEKDCYDTTANPMTDFDRSFLPYKSNQVYLFKDTLTNKIYEFKCDTIYDYVHKYNHPGECKYNTTDYSIYCSLISKSFLDNNDLNILCSIYSQRQPPAYDIDPGYNDYKLLNIEINYPNNNTLSNYRGYVKESSKRLIFVPLTSRQPIFISSIKLDSIDYFNVNVIQADGGDYQYNDNNFQNIYLNNEKGIICFTIVIQNRKFNLIFKGEK